MTKHYAFLPVHALLALLLAAVVASCLWEPSYPGELSQADSLMIQGHYRQAIACWPTTTAPLPPGKIDGDRDTAEIADPARYLGGVSYFSLAAKWGRTYLFVYFTFFCSWPFCHIWST
ncbi:MAG: hypothetical protein IJ841_05820 [Prevotella sp.]|nr:hypothetical protein [Prevotella sp.]